MWQTLPLTARQSKETVNRNRFVWHRLNACRNCLSRVYHTRNFIHHKRVSCQLSTDCIR